MRLRENVCRSDSWSATKFQITTKFRCSKRLPYDFAIGFEPEIPLPTSNLDVEKWSSPRLWKPKTKRRSATSAKEWKHRSKLSKWFNNPVQQLASNMKIHHVLAIRLGLAMEDHLAWAFGVGRINSLKMQQNALNWNILIPKSNNKLPIKSITQFRAPNTAIGQRRGLGFTNRCCKRRGDWQTRASSRLREDYWDKKQQS